MHRSQSWGSSRGRPGWRSPAGNVSGCRGRTRRPTSGRARAAQIAELASSLGVDVVLFDDELAPNQQRNLEQILGEDVKVLDRSALILDVFASHARSHEGKIQVELAQLEYRLPRLTRMWTHLARQAGGRSAGNAGVGVRGPGETQLEVDRRRVRHRISRLRKDLQSISAARSGHRERRRRSRVPVAALVGYANAGKSTLMNALTGAGVRAENRLFATLDPTTRRVQVNDVPLLLTDTVGFVQKFARQPGGRVPRDARGGGGGRSADPRGRRTPPDGARAGGRGGCACCASSAPPTAPR